MPIISWVLLKMHKMQFRKQLLKNLSIAKDKIQNQKNYLIKSVINYSINFKNKHKKLVDEEVWLPEPLITNNIDNEINKEEIISYSILVLLEKLNVNERAVFILKEAFNYSHNEISEVLSCSVENSRKLLSRAKKKLEKINSSNILVKSTNEKIDVIENYIDIIKNNKIDELELLLSEEVTLSADGGDKVNVVINFSSDKQKINKVLLLVYNTFLQNKLYKITYLNHQPAIIYFEEKGVLSCQIFEIDKSNKIKNIYAVVDPQKLGKLLS